MLPEEDQDWLVDALATLMRRHGPKPFLEAPLIEADPRWFPDAWNADAASVERILSRLLGYAGIPQIRPRLELVRSDADLYAESWRRHENAPAWFWGIDEQRVAHFGCVDTHFEQPDVLVAHLCHEVAHAWRFHHEAEVFDRDEEERLTDVTTVYLGFGLFTANAALLQSSHREGFRESTRWHRSGYLAAPHFAFLLAAQAVCRDLGWCARRALAGQLAPDQATLFRSSFRRLCTPRGELQWRLGLSSSDRAPG